MTARVSLPSRTAWIVSSCPGRNESKPKISFSTFRGTNLIVSSRQSAVSDRRGDEMPETDASEVNRSVIERFYNELWNGWSLAVADKIVSENLRFRGSLGSTLEGLEGFKDYVGTVRDAFPDWHNRIDELIVCGDRVVTRMTWSGTHRGTLLGVEPTGKRVQYVGAAIFRLVGGRIEDGWVVGDTARVRPPSRAASPNAPRGPRRFRPLR